MLSTISRLIITASACVALTGCATQPQAARPLKIASWNLEHLAEVGASGCKPRTDADYAVLKGYADRLEADVIAFQEVQSAKAAARVFDPARYDIVIEERPGSAEASPCRGLEGRFINRQAVGFAIRKGLKFERREDLTALQIGDPNLRSGVDVVVRPKGQPAVRLLTVHLKSGCASGMTNEACAVFQRQVPVLEAWIDARASEGLRFAVLGDFNRRLGQAGDRVWTELDDAEPANADLSLAAGGQGPRCDPRFRDFIDHIVLDRRAGADLFGFTELTYAADTDRPSDHCPIVATLR